MQGVAAEPLVKRRAELVKPPGFPGGGGDGTDVLTAEVNPGFFGQPELFGVKGHPVRADLLPGDVKEDVAGLGNGLGEVRLTMRLPAAEAGAAQMVRAGAVNGAMRRDCAGFQSRAGDDRLEGRTRRVHGVHRPVNQGMGLVFVERVPVLGRNARCELVRVKGRRGGHGQHGPRLRVDGDRRADKVMLGKSALRRRLRRGVNGELHRAAGRGVLRVYRTNRAAMRVNLYVRAARLAAQIGFIRRFHAGLAEEIIAEIALRLARFPFVPVDPPHCPQQMRGQRPARIPADGFRLGADTRQKRLVFFNLRHCRHRHVQRDSERVIRVLLGVGNDLPDVIGQDMEQAGQTVQRHRVFGDFGRGVNGEAGAVGGQQDAMPVGDCPARRACADAPGLVGGGGLTEIIAVRDLQVPQAGEQTQKQQGNDDAEPPGALAGRPLSLSA